MAALLQRHCQRKIGLLLTGRRLAGSTTETGASHLQLIKPIVSTGVRNLCLTTSPKRETSFKLCDIAG